MSHKARHRLVPLNPLGLAPTVPEANTDGLRIVLSNRPHILTIITPHGLEVDIAVTADGMLLLHAMLTKQAEQKVVPPRGLAPTYILAEWERIGPHGAGKELKPEYGGPPRQYTSRGKPIIHAYDLEPI